MTSGAQDSLGARRREMEACISEGAPFERLRRIDAFLDSLKNEDARELGTTEEGFSVATMLTFLHTYSWSRWQQRIPYEESMYQIPTEPLRLHALVRLGVEVTIPDAKGRVAAIQAFANAALTINADDVLWAFGRGVNPLQVESLDGQQRSLLSLSFRTNLRCEEVVSAIHLAIDHHLDLLPLASRQAALSSLLQAPVCPEHEGFKSTLIGRQLRASLPWPAATPSRSLSRF